MNRAGTRGRRWGPYAAGSGIAFAVLALIAFFLAGGPEAEATPEEILEYFADNSSAVKWQAFLFGLAGVFFLWFAGTLASAIRNAEPETGGRLASISLAGAAASAAIYFAGIGAWAALAEILADEEGGAAGAEGAGIANALFSVGDMTLAMANFTAAVFAAAAALAFLRTRLLPDWLGWAGVALAAAAIVNGAIQIFSDSEVAATIGVIVFLLFLAWVAAVSGLLTRWWLRREDEGLRAGATART